MKIFNYVIIEDSLPDRLLLEEYLSKYDFLHLTGSFANPIESLEHFKTQTTHILFMDIDMPGMSGIDFLRSFSAAPHCIFVTVHPEFAIDAFEIQAIDYVLKPIKPERLDKAIQRTIELDDIKLKALQYNLHFENDYLMIKEGTSVSKVSIADIIYLEALTNYTKIVTGKRNYITLNNLKNFLEHLPHNKFMRIHRSYAVAIDKIGGLNKNEILAATYRLPLGKTYQQEIKKAIRENI